MRRRSFQEFMTDMPGCMSYNSATFLSNINSSFIHHLPYKTDDKISAQVIDISYWKPFVFLEKGKLILNSFIYPDEYSSEKRYHGITVEVQVA